MASLAILACLTRRKAVMDELVREGEKLGMYGDS
jgi:hypothetical protein